MQSAVGRLAFSAALALAFAVPSHATTVSPMVLDLQTTGRGVVANISVNNTSDKPVPIEVAMQALDPTATGLVAGTASTDDLLVNPPTALILPGQTQSFRVQWIGDPMPATSKHYFVSINQLPVKMPEGQSAVQIGGDQGAAGAAEKGTGVVPEPGAAGHIECAGECQVCDVADHLDQRAAHAATRAGHRDAQGRGQRAHERGSSGG